MHTTALRESLRAIGHYDFATDRLRKPDGTLAKVTAADHALIQAVWDAYDVLRSNFLLNRTRRAFVALTNAAAELVAFQARMGVWLIHPANAGPGLKADDPRIRENIA